jgi:mannose-1-phosphate guanylyltransferase
MDCDWLDVGSWEAIAALHAADAAGNVTIGAKSVTIDSNGNTMASENDHLIVTIGVNDLIVVHSEDATLVCRKADAQRVRNIVEKCREEFGDRYL